LFHYLALSSKGLFNDVSAALLRDGAIESRELQKTIRDVHKWANST
jgi:hypothetical protein